MITGRLTYSTFSFTIIGCLHFILGHLSFLSVHIIEDGSFLPDIFISFLTLREIRCFYLLRAL